MNKDTHLIFEAYKKRLTESDIPRLSPGVDKEIRYTHSKDGSASSPYVQYVLNGTGKSVYFYYDAQGNFERGLIKGNDGSGMNLHPFRKEDIENIANENKLQPEEFYKAIEDGSNKVKMHHSSAEANEVPDGADNGEDEIDTNGDEEATPGFL